MIQFSHLYKSYTGPVHALRDINLDIQRGEFAFLMGPSGAGKTTLFRMLSAYEKMDSGHLQVGHYDLARLDHRQVPYFRRRIGVIFQDFRLLSDRTVAENVALPLLIRQEKPLLIEKKVNEILEKVGLLFKKDKYPLQLSGGEQQRVAIARGVIHQPDVVIADEPTGNLDSEKSAEIIDLFEQVNAQGTTVFIATHDESIVQQRSRRIVRLQQGQIIGDSFAQ